MVDTAAQPRTPRRLLARIARVVMWVAIGAVLVGIVLWSVLAVGLADLSQQSPRYFLAAIVGAAQVAAVIFIRRRVYGLVACGAIFGCVLGWYLMLQPSNDRAWAPELAEVPWAEFQGNTVTIHNVRNFNYRAETDFDPAWDVRTYDLEKVRSVDYILVYWGSKAIAHAIVSFGFDDGRYLAISIETRKERGESYSALQGFFRQYELIYVIADERDVLRLRTHFRNEDVYLYRTRFSPQNAQVALRSYLQHANALRQKPEWYNALTTNCATSVLPHARAGGAAGTMSCDVLLSGYSARQVYRNGNLDDRLPFEELERRSYINAASQAAPNDTSYSSLIRAGLPDPTNVVDANPGR